MSTNGSNLTAANAAGGIFSATTTFIVLGVLFVITFIAIYVYFKVFGYTMQMGWDRLKAAFDNKEKVDVSAVDSGDKTDIGVSLVPPANSDTTNTTDSKDLKTILGMPQQSASGASITGDSGGNSADALAAAAAKSGSLAPPSPGTTDTAMARRDPGYEPGSPSGALPFDPEERPSGMPGAQQEPSPIRKMIRAIKKQSDPAKTIFNVSRNVYTYDEAAPLCKAMGAELATYDMVLEAQKKGADWCNYGWVKGQMAIFPTQAETWNKLQTGPAEYRNSCGKPGVNGGYFDNPELRFGVNCFGPRPAQKDTDELLTDTDHAYPPTAEQIDFDKKVQKFRDGLESITVLPFSRQGWEEK